MSIFNHFKHLNLSSGQVTALTKLEAFLDSPTQVLMLKGYAGSGKTTILKGLAEYLSSLKKDFDLLAPTGRAAKVLRDKTGRGKTIHKGIYNFSKFESVNQESKDVAEHSFHYFFPIAQDDTNEKIIIVDESSMISNKKSTHELFTFGTNVLLSDLLTFARLKTSKNKIIFVGDPAQLPPFGDSNSSALDKKFFDDLEISNDEVELKEVKRQSKNLILKNAELLRDVLEKNTLQALKFEYDLDSFIKIEPSEIISKYVELYPKPEIGDGVIVAYSNEQCYQYNIAIREKIYPVEKNITAGDLVIINNNNYFTYGVELFNGDIAKVVYVDPNTINQSAPVYVDEAGKKVRKIITLTYRNIKIRVPNHPNDIPCKIIDSLLNSTKRDLSIPEMKSLYINFLMRFNDVQNRNKEKGFPSYKVSSEEFKQELKSDPFFNALRVKYGYAITCHKAQGGEWSKVFVDYFGRVSAKSDPVRWCYTATTRAVDTCYALNAPHFGKLSKLKFTPIVKIGTLPNDALFLDNIPTSPFHKTDQHKCKSLKFWEVQERLERASFEIENVETFGYLERYTLKHNDKTIQVQASHKLSGVFIDQFAVCNTSEIEINKTILEIFNSQSNYIFNINYQPGKEFLENLYSFVQQSCIELDITITNVVESRNYVNFYFRSDAICSYVQFYFNDKGELTIANPKSYKDDDEKLKQLILKIEDYAS
ncbi:MAG: DEAD/DEAH box helicase [Ginsengibacter sp.]